MGSIVEATKRELDNVGAEEEATKRRKITTDGAAALKKKITEEEKKLIYLCGQKPCEDMGPGWLVIDPHSCDGYHLNPLYGVGDDPQLSSYPPHLAKIDHFANTVWGSKIYFIGGSYLPGEEVLYGYNTDASRRVFAYDTSTRSWDDELEPMQVTRSEHTAIAVRNKIYVFGGAQPDKLLLQPGLAHWGECYDIATNKWVYLTPPTQEIFITSYALVKNSSQILFWLPYPKVMTIYDLDDNLWLSDPGHPAPYMFPWWSDRVVVLADSFLIWSYAGTIYAYDLHKKQLLPPFEELDAPDLKTIPERYPECHGSSKHTFLVNAGNGVLALVWLTMFHSNVLQCSTFRVEVRGEDEESGDAPLRFVPLASAKFYTPYCYVEDVVTSV